MISATTRISIYQILLPSTNSRQELELILDGIIDLDVIAALEGLIAQWESIQSARIPSKSGITRVDVIEFDPKSKSHELCCMEWRVKASVAALIGWEMEVLSF